MKKAIIFILAVLYLYSTAGATVHLHYCMDKLVNWTLSDTARNKCDNCGMEKDGNCCKDENKFVKNSSDQRVAELFIQHTQAVAIIPSLFINSTEPLFVSLIQKSSTGYSPPVPIGNDIYLFNCVFRI